MPSTQSFQRRVLLMTNSEYGQANSIIAIAHALAIQPNVEVHFASFHDAESRLEELRASLQGTDTLGLGSSLSFHDIGGISMKEAICQLPDMANYIHGCGFWGALDSYRNLTKTLFGWKPEQYMEAVNGCVNIIKKVNPHAIVIDNLLCQGVDACRQIGKKYISAGPLSLKDITMELQPRSLLNYPMMSTAYPFPLPWSKVLPNLAVGLYLGYSLFTSPGLKALNAVRHAAGLKGLPPMFQGFQTDIEYLIPTIPEIDLAVTVIPPNITICGPFILPVFGTIEDADPGLAIWLKAAEGRTILVNLGTHTIADANMTQQLARGISSVIQHERDHGRKLQFLWKLKLSPDSEVDSILQTELGREIKNGDVRVLGWLSIDPLALLQGHIMCSVHHGGANSYFESILNGIPHVILPRWYDLYDYAQRAEYLGVRIFASKTVAPDVDSVEFANAVIRVIAPQSTYIKKAKELAHICKAKCRGRELGAERILIAADQSLFSEQT
ncbi:hypothetical protein BDQ12DRAFT_608098 [Crucibulum laeve]|uniref:Erythromycin biosynthesis protein CIII-like C-terminal domain-containing protein n=1 Tax=Crucibulum laeve TaxID=68775 RepID=A0A5C3LXC5_9AGAR|nr:hypothetical protein BDQ12DRAFT_608098 [Crucibulum laeve]